MTEQISSNTRSAPGVDGSAIGLPAEDALSGGGASPWTPGPWKIGTFGDVCHGDGNWTGVKFVFGFAEGAIDRTSPEVIANTRLIAAAPELYEALATVVAALDASRDGGLYPDFELWECQARAALAKASPTPPDEPSRSEGEQGDMASQGSLACAGADDDEGFDHCRCCGRVGVPMPPGAAR